MSCQAGLGLARPAHLAQLAKAALFSTELSSTGVFQLSTGGRSLAFRAYGRPCTPSAPKPEIALFFPGNLNSRWFRASWEQTEAQAHEVGVRVIQIDRPGVGASAPGVRGTGSESYAEFARDVCEFLDSLEIDRCSLMGFSSGGPYALAVAAQFPRVNSLVLMSADGQYADPELVLPTKELMYEAIPMSREQAVKRTEEMAGHLRDAYAAIKSKERREIALGDLNEALMGSISGPAQDSYLETRPWDFDLMSVRAEQIWVFHGKNDESVPFQVAEYLTERIPGSRLVAVEREIHSMIRRKWKEMLLATTGREALL